MAALIPFPYKSVLGNSVNSSKWTTRQLHVADKILKLHKQHAILQTEHLKTCWKCRLNCTKELYLYIQLNCITVQCCMAHISTDLKHELCSVHIIGTSTLWANYAVGKWSLLQLDYKIQTAHLITFHSSAPELFAIKGKCGRTLSIIWSATEGCHFFLSLEDCLEDREPCSRWIPFIASTSFKELLSCFLFCITMQSAGDSENCCKVAHCWVRCHFDVLAQSCLFLWRLCQPLYTGAAGLRLKVWGAWGMNGRRIIFHRPWTQCAQNAVLLFSAFQK